MKLITAVIKPFKLDEVREALSESKRFWTPKRSYRNVSRRRVCCRFFAKN
jgi:nitrogen regulatory protein PII